MIITESELGNHVELSLATGRNVLNLNRDPKTRTYDAIVMGDEIEDVLNNRDGTVKIEKLIKAEFGICYCQACKYRVLSRAANTEYGQELIAKHSVNGFEAVVEVLKRTKQFSLR